MKRFYLLFTAAFFLSTQAQAHEVRIEAGGYRTVSNRFNIPNPGGSRVNVNEPSLRVYGRAQGMLQLSERGYLRLLLAPLNATYSYTPSSTLVYNGKVFAAGSPAEIFYKFNSYRLGYIYRWTFTPGSYVQVGGIGKIRQAEISVTGGGQTSSYTNVGFVPLLNVGASWKVIPEMGLRFDLDGAAAKQGRAFDGSLEAFFPLNEKEVQGISAGIRVLEGGADNDKVNTFALLQYAFVAYTHEL